MSSTSPEKNSKRNTNNNEEEQLLPDVSDERANDDNQNQHSNKNNNEDEAENDDLVFEHNDDEGSNNDDNDNNNNNDDTLSSGVKNNFSQEEKDFLLLAVTMAFGGLGKNELTQKEISDYITNVYIKDFPNDADATPMIDRLCKDEDVIGNGLQALLWDAAIYSVETDENEDDENSEIVTKYGLSGLDNNANDNEDDNNHHNGAENNNNEDDDGANDDLNKHSSNSSSQQQQKGENNNTNVGEDVLASISFRLPDNVADERTLVLGLILKALVEQFHQNGRISLPEKSMRNKIIEELTNEDSSFSAKFLEKQQQNVTEDDGKSSPLAAPTKQQQQQVKDHCTRMFDSAFYDLTASFYIDKLLQFAAPHSIFGSGAATHYASLSSNTNSQTAKRIAGEVARYVEKEGERNVMSEITINPWRHPCAQYTKTAPASIRQRNVSLIPPELRTDDLVSYEKIGPFYNEAQKALDPDAIAPSMKIRFKRVDANGDEIPEGEGNTNNNNNNKRLARLDPRDADKLDLLFADLSRILSSSRTIVLQKELMYQLCKHSPWQSYERRTINIMIGHLNNQGRLAVFRSNYGGTFWYGLLNQCNFPLFANRELFDFNSAPSGISLLIDIKRITGRDSCLSFLDLIKCLQWLGWKNFKVRSELIEEAARRRNIYKFFVADVRNSGKKELYCASTSDAKEDYLRHIARQQQQKPDHHQDTYSTNNNNNDNNNSSTLLYQQHVRAFSEYLQDAERGLSPVVSRFWNALKKLLSYDGKVIKRLSDVSQLLAEKYGWTEKDERQRCYDALERAFLIGTMKDKSDYDQNRLFKIVPGENPKGSKTLKRSSPFVHPSLYEKYLPRGVFVGDRFPTATNDQHRNENSTRSTTTTTAATTFVAPPPTNSSSSLSTKTATNVAAVSNNDEISRFLCLLISRDASDFLHQLKGSFRSVGEKRELGPVISEMVLSDKRWIDREVRERIVKELTDLNLIKIVRHPRQSHIFHISINPVHATGEFLTLNQCKMLIDVARRATVRLNPRESDFLARLMMLMASSPVASGGAGHRFIKRSAVLSEFVDKQPSLGYTRHEVNFFIDGLIKRGLRDNTILTEVPLGRGVDPRDMSRLGLLFHEDFLRLVSEAMADPKKRPTLANVEMRFGNDFGHLFSSNGNGNSNNDSANSRSTRGAVDSIADGPRRRSRSFERATTADTDSTRRQQEGRYIGDHHHHHQQQQQQQQHSSSRGTVVAVSGGAPVPQGWANTMAPSYSSSGAIVTAPPASSASNNNQNHHNSSRDRSHHSVENSGEKSSRTSTSLSSHQQQRPQQQYTHHQYPQYQQPPPTSTYEAFAQPPAVAPPPDSYYYPQASYPAVQYQQPPPSQYQYPPPAADPASYYPPSSNNNNNNNTSTAAASSSNSGNNNNNNNNNRGASSSSASVQQPVAAATSSNQAQQQQQQSYSPYDESFFFPSPAKKEEKPQNGDNEQQRSQQQQSARIIRIPPGHASPIAFPPPLFIRNGLIVDRKVPGAKLMLAPPPFVFLK